MSQKKVQGNSARARVTKQEVSPASLEEEYRYVITDLKRIAILAAAMLALLVLLAFILV
ncbi:MAG TPA: hypothetical protein PLM06_00805 [Anaerolineae bacterium]|nr:hypothetical protein [Anaerolineae bacterium]